MSNAEKLLRGTGDFGLHHRIQIRPLALVGRFRVGLRLVHGRSGHDPHLLSSLQPVEGRLEVRQSVTKIRAKSKEGRFHSACCVPEKSVHRTAIRHLEYGKVLFIPSLVIGALCPTSPLLSPAEIDPQVRSPYHHDSNRSFPPLSQPHVDYCYLGTTGVKISPLCLGTMSFGEDADPETANSMFARCRNAGINVFDCANVYAEGTSERILGDLITDCRDEVVITSKAYFPTGDGPNDRGGSRYHLVRAVENSLHRLGTDRLDVLFLHRFDPKTALHETLRALDDLVRQGKVLYLGASNFAAWQVMKGLGLQRREGWSPFHVLQPMYNLAKRQAEVEILPMAQNEDLGVLPYSPLGGGLLTGKYGVDTRPDEGRLVENPMYQTRYGADEHYAVADRFVDFAERHGYDPVPLAVAWVQHHPAVTAPIIGGRNLNQLEDSLAALEIDMTPDLRDAISELSPAPPPATDRTEERSEHTYGDR